LVEGPPARPLRIGLVVDSPIAKTDEPTRRVVEATAPRLEAMRHRVAPATLPFGQEFSRDFLSYWGYIAWVIAITGPVLLDTSFRTGRLAGLTTGLRRRFRTEFRRTP
ncbi:hypothetical protein VM98_37475, partial [Streptomyces rubellomurinus subsp. indigoferus]